MAKKRPDIDVKRFRKAVAVLKKKGIIKNVDARSATPGMKRGGRRLDTLVEKYDDVISGKLEPVKLSPKNFKRYKAAGYETASGRVLVPKTAIEKVKLTKSGDVALYHPSGTRRVKQAVPFHRLKQWAAEMKDKGPEIDLRKGEKAFWGYKFKGHRSMALYEDMDLLIEELMEGTASGLNFNDFSGPKDERTFYDGIEFFIVNDRKAWERERKRQRKTTVVRRRERRTERKYISDKQRRYHAEYERKRRAALKGAKLEEYKRKARKRAKKSHGKKRKPKGKK